MKAIETKGGDTRNRLCSVDHMRLEMSLVVRFRKVESWKVRNGWFCAHSISCLLLDDVITRY